MIKKYEMLDDDTIMKLFDGRTLKRIRALITIPGIVEAGELGGYIESEENLSHESDAWVGDNARVYGKARVSGDAEVCGDAVIFWASKVGTENGTLTVYNGKDNGLLCTRGCFSGTVDEFLAASKEYHDKRTQKEYKLLIKVAKSRIEHGVKKE